LSSLRVCPAALVLVGGVSVVLASTTAPLLVYSLALATFGGVHVVSELRYLDRRFGMRIGAARLAAMAMLLIAAVSVRSLGLARWMEVRTAVSLELAAVALLAPTAVTGRPVRAAFALAVAAALALATLRAPFDTAVVLAILHNLTPLAFLYEFVEPRARRRVMLPALAGLIGLPLFVATGVPRDALALGGIVPAGLGPRGFAGSLDPRGAGTLVEHLHVYVPEPLLASACAIDLFTAVVVAQCAHYAAVIVVLPALLAARDPDARGWLRWPRGWFHAGALCGLALASLAAFASDFVGARALYGLAASVHAWIEVPLIVVALTATSAITATCATPAGRAWGHSTSPQDGQPSSTRPAATDAALASVDSASARSGESPDPQATTSASTTTTTVSATSAPGT